MSAVRGGRAPGGGWAGLADRIARGTPPERNRTVDGVRALSILGVVLGHWLVTALVAGPVRLTIASPLQHLPAFAGLTWVLQTLGLFFLVGGYANARSLASARAAGRSWRSWFAGRLARLARPVAVLLAVWALAAAALVAAGLPAATVRTVALLVVQPLWFLGVYLAVTALAPLSVWAHRTAGAASVLAPFAVVAAVDVLRFAPGTSGPGWAGWLAVLPAWLVAAQLGVAWEAGALGSRRSGAALAVGGGALAGVLVAAAGYPASMVGLPDAARSNLSPPSLMAPAVACLQAGLMLLAQGPLGRALRRPGTWAAVALVNLSAMTIFLWHQTALVAVTLAAVPLGPVRGLHDVPADLGWVLARLGWLAVFALVLGALWAAFGRFERG